MHVKAVLSRNGSWETNTPRMPWRKDLPSGLRSAGLSQQLLTGVFRVFSELSKALLRFSRDLGGGVGSREPRDPRRAHKGEEILSLRFRACGTGNEVFRVEAVSDNGDIRNLTTVKYGGRP